MPTSGVTAGYGIIEEDVTAVPENTRTTGNNGDSRNLSYSGNVSR